MPRWFLLLAALFSSAAAASVPRAGGVWESNPPAATTKTAPSSSLSISEASLPLAQLLGADDDAALEPRFRLFEPGVAALVEAGERESFHPLQGVELVDTESRRGPPVSYPETRVWVIEVLGTTFVGEATGLSVELRPACGGFCCGVVSGDGKDPLGLQSEDDWQDAQEYGIDSAIEARSRVEKSLRVAGRIASGAHTTLDVLTDFGPGIGAIKGFGYFLSALRSGDRKTLAMYGGAVALGSAVSILARRAERLERVGAKAVNEVEEATLAAERRAAAEVEAATGAAERQRLSRVLESSGERGLATANPESSLAKRIEAKMALYPNVVDPRTGRNVPFPAGVTGKAPKASRVAFGAKERGEYIAEWYRRGYETPKGGWDKYDIHHIQPKEYGGTNDFWNLVPVERNTHQDAFNAFWREFTGM